MRKKLLQVVDSLGAGGAERLVVEVVNGLPQFEHHLIVLNGPETLESELPHSCFFHNFDRRSNKDILSPCLKLKKYIRQHKIDLVHSHLFFSSVMARLATPRRVPLLNSIHIISSLDNYTKNRLSLYLEKLTYRGHHHIIAVSQAVMDDFDLWVGLKGPRTVLYNFIRDEFFAQQACPKPVTASLRLVAVGNLRYQKNYPYLLAAFQNMPAGVSLDIYGSGEMQQSLQEEIDRLQLPIRLMGSQKNLHEVLPTYDAYVMSSFFEGQPLSLLEAIACGLPAILSDIPVLREVTGPHALYFNLNEPLDLVEKVRAILAGKIDLQALAVPALETISAFARKEVYFSKLAALYESKLAMGKKNTMQP